MINNLPIIYQKINSIKDVREEDFEDLFNEIYGLINKNFEHGNLWISFYSYYNLFSSILNRFGNKDSVICKYFFILSEIQKIVKKIDFNQQIEILLNNPFNKDDFLQRLEKIFGKTDYTKLRDEIEKINLGIPNFNEDILNQVFVSLSIHDSLKIVKILYKKFGKADLDKLSRIILEKIEIMDKSEITDVISDIVDFGVKNKDDDFVQFFLQNLLVSIIIKLDKKYDFGDAFNKTFVVSTYENISRYFRLVGNFGLSSCVYLLAAVENWKLKNYGYCASCIYKISRMVYNEQLSIFLLFIAIRIASMEVSFEREIKVWKAELNNRCVSFNFNFSCRKFFEDLLSSLCDEKLLLLLNSKIDEFCFFVDKIVRNSFIDSWVNMN